MKIRDFTGELPPERKKGGKWKYPIPNLEVGQCFDVSYRDLASVRSSVSQYGRKSGKTFAVRETETGYICIRTA
jgi:hypothetical protein